MKSILFLGEDSLGSTSRHRADALRRLGHEVVIVNPASLLKAPHRLQIWFDYRTGYRRLQKQLLGCLRDSNIRSVKPNLIWIDSGELLGPIIMNWLRRTFAAQIILYNIDDPTGPRDWLRFASLRAALPLYDLCVCVRLENQLEWLALGAKRVLRVWRSYDEELHAALDEHKESDKSDHSSLLFIGTLIPGERRDRFLLNLIDAGLPLKIIGDRWKRSAYWPKLRSAYQGQGITGAEYPKAIASAGLCLGFLSHGNRDLHTTRTAEVPYAGGVFHAERTSEHQLLYECSLEASFWSSITECIGRCHELLPDPRLRASVRHAASKRVREMGIGNEDICRQILATL